MSETAIRNEPAPGRAAALRRRLSVLVTDRSHDGVARRTAMLAFGIRVASAAIAYLAQILLARWMGAHDYGVYVFVWTWVLFLGNLSGLGFGMASLRFVPEHRERGETELLRGYLVASRLVALGAGTAFALAGLVAIRLMGDAIGSAFVWPLVLALVCLPMFALTETQEGVARAIDAPGVGLFPPYILRPLLILAFMAIEHHVGVPASAARALECAIAATWITALVQAIGLNARLRPVLPAGPRAFRMRHWLAAALPLFVADGAHVLFLNIDVLVLTAFASPEQVGVYFAVTKTLVLGAFVAFAVGAAVAHRYAEYHVAGDAERLQAFVTQSARWTFWPTLATVVLMLALGRPFLQLFGPAFVEGYPLLFVLSLGVLARAAFGPADRLLAVLGQQGAFARVVLVTLAVAVVLHLTLIPLFGPMGAAVAVALSAVVEGALYAWIARTRLNLHVGVWVRPRSGAKP